MMLCVVVKYCNSYSTNSLSLARPLTLLPLSINSHDVGLMLPCRFAPVVIVVMAIVMGQTPLAKVLPSDVLAVPRL